MGSVVLLLLALRLNEVQNLPVAPEENAVKWDQQPWGYRSCTPLR